MLRLNTGINGILRNFLFKLLVAELIKLCTHDSLRSVCDNAKLLTDSNRRILMVARNHNRTDTCLTALVDSSLNLGTNRINHACKTDKDKVVFKSFGSEIRRSGVIFFI